MQDEQGKAISANIANLPSAQQLASSVNKFNSDEILKMLRAAIPGYDNMVGKASGVIQSQLSGEVPQDVQNLIQSKAAARAVGGGYGGSGLHGNLGLRDLGLTSLQMTQQGLNSASQWLQTMKATATAPQFNVASMFIDPATQLNFALADRTEKFNRNWMKNQIDAMPSPTEQAAMGVLKNFDKLTWSAASSFTGGMMGGMGGGMGGGGFDTQPADYRIGNPMGDSSYGVADLNPKSYGKARSMLGY